ncbi:MAG: DNA primase [Anaerolineae bacterium]
MGVVDDVKSRLDIVEFIAGYVPSLKKAGRTYKGLCPFHTEKTPSFIVFPETQTWHCFGACGTGGDIFTFAMRREGLDFGETLKLLAAKAGVSLQEPTPETIEADRERRKLLEIVAAAAVFFNDQLLTSPQAAAARDYIAGRGLNAQTVHQFQLGFAPDRWEALTLHLQERGYTPADLLAAGLVTARDDGSPGHDRFRNRLVFPIRDVRGQVLGFGARALRQEQIPKYLNSPQSALFDKSALLYALDVAKGTIRDSGQAVIVEGYMDALQAHQQGFKNVVAQMGTALTEPQLKQLKRFARQFVLALDADSAGSAATLRGINVARESLSEEVVPVPTARGLIRYEGRLQADIRIASLPPGQDPDDVLKEDSGAWQRLIQQALPLVDYYIRVVTAPLDLETAKGKAAAVQELMPLLREIQNPVEQSHYLQQLARIVKIDERTLRAELQRSRAAPEPAVQHHRPTPPSLPSLSPPAGPRAAAGSPAGLEAYCLAMLIGQPGILDEVNQKLLQNQVDVLAVQDFTSAENGALFLAIKKWPITPNPTLESLQSQVDDHLQGRLAELITMWQQRPSPPAENVARELPKIIVRLRRQKLSRQIKELNLLQRDALENNDTDTAATCQTLVSQAKEKLGALDKARDALSIMGRRRLEEKYLG